MDFSAAMPATTPQQNRPSRSKRLQDDSVMGTNNSSIVSKRSVERLYYSDEDHFFRHFVKKPQRRSPLINRGYWLRMKAIDHVVRQFLDQSSPKNKIVINLGCGYDPLPWQCMARYPTASKLVTFIDIDYKDLMVKKQNVVKSTSHLSSMLTNIKYSDGDFLLESDQYFQIGCDLEDLASLQTKLASVVHFENSVILFTAEVSITYMDVPAADALIKWCGSLPDARFCLLEQLMPGGLEHPFAQTMKAHFDKLQTPLRPVLKYPTTLKQESRFTDLGWGNAKARNLWDLYCDPLFIAPTQRKSLDLIEPFDEWEEFALFGCHYVLLVASTAPITANGHAKLKAKVLPNHVDSPSVERGLTISMYATMSEYPKAQGFKRFASALSIPSSDPGEDVIGNFAGMGLNTRVNTTDIYVSNQLQPISRVQVSTPSNRMCHTTTDLGDNETLLIGGRTSPDTALPDCWVYHKWLNTWERISDIPTPRYRHQTVHLGQGYVLVSPGRANSRAIADDYLFWSRRTGWRVCIIDGEVPPAVYGATFTLDPRAHLHTMSGILAGGITEDGILTGSMWQWEIKNITEAPLINFRQILHTQELPSIARFGASTVSHCGKIYIVGGVSRHDLLQLDEEVLCWETQAFGHSVSTVSLVYESRSARPLLLGITLASKGRNMIIMGGSAVCFSFGTFWNKGNYTLGAHPPHSPAKSSALTSVWSFLCEAQSTIPANRIVTNLSLRQAAPTLIGLPRVQIKSQADFAQIVKNGKPIVIERSNIGTCTSTWTPDYLKQKIGTDREVVIHEATTEQMDFRLKNFSYVKKPFGEFLDEIQNGRRLYLRSLASERPTEQPADIVKDFPSISKDFTLPPELAAVMENAHSSPLRISGNVTMWLHYDVMANVLCQVWGRKRLLLFPPSDVKYFSFSPGASSSGADVFRNLHEYPESHPYEALLEPGDILFIPPLWLHAASPISEMTTGVNIFFRNLTSGYAPGKDVYGNRDLQAYEKGRLDIARIIKGFEGLPIDIRKFYGERLAHELEDMSR